MVAGATGIDLFLLIIDAAEGARPQTLEHLAILRLLGVDRGVVALTKADLVDEETLEIGIEEARELVPGVEVVAVSAKTGAGLDELRAALARVADEAPARDVDGLARLYVDRVFTLRGIGTVVTGTLWSGTIAEGDTLRIAPRGGEVRVRSVQVHDAPVAQATAGERVALGLPGVERTRAPPGRRARRTERVSDLVSPRRRAGGADADRERRPRLRPSRDITHCRSGRSRRRPSGAAAARSSRRRGAR